jgi:hypothetical protein
MAVLHKSIADFDEWIGQGSFARHETFCPRYGWLKKGFEGVRSDSSVFDSPDAIERLGVGKNMVRSIRFWCVAFHIIASPEPNGKPRLSGPMCPTEFGKRLLDEDGCDPFLEDPASLWLLHWKLFVPPLSGIAWSMAMNIANISTFNQKLLTKMLLDQKEQHCSLSRYSDSSVAKDTSCFLRMYAPPRNSFGDELDCPFTHLGLLAHTDERQTYRFREGSKSNLPDLIFLAACFEYALIVQPHLRNFPISRITFDYNSPGVVFRLSETDIGHRLSRAAELLEDVELVESYGHRLLYFAQPPEDLHWKCLDLYYKENK